MKSIWFALFSVVFFFTQRTSATIDISLQMQLGNPSGAITDTNNHDHYLIQRTVEAIDYSDNLGEPVWASWDLTAGDIGGSGRNSTYYTDTNLPPNFYRVTTTDYNGVGTNLFNRGHLCPSADRTDTTNDNKLVFFMSNIMPQSAENNQGVWGNFEDYCRSMLTTNELLIICGGSGFGTNTIPSGKAYIPSNTWKIVVAIPLGDGTALSRLTATNRVISISIPNVTNGLSSAWQTYVTSARQIELDTGFTFFTAVPGFIASVYRARIDGTSAPAITSFSPTNGAVGDSITITGT
ncbi:MAG TPA: DNA/RNA non-specific endonuclease, partial [Verrucomicrobiae bacterium]